MNVVRCDKAEEGEVSLLIGAVLLSTDEGSKWPSSDCPDLGRAVESNGRSRGCTVIIRHRSTGSQGCERV